MAYNISMKQNRYLILGHKRQNEFLFYRLHHDNTVLLVLTAVKDNLFYTFLIAKIIYYKMMLILRCM